jgi:hypothetical protein
VTDTKLHMNIKLPSLYSVWEKNICSLFCSQRDRGLVKLNNLYKATQLISDRAELAERSVWFQSSYAYKYNKSQW